MQISNDYILYMLFRINNLRTNKHVENVFTLKKKNEMGNEYVPGEGSG